MTVETNIENRTRPLLLIIAWSLILLVSILPEILLKEVFGIGLPWLSWLKVGLVAATWVVTLVWARLRPLSVFLLVLLVLLLAEWLFYGVIQGSSAWRARFNGSDFVTVLLDTQLLRLGVALVMIAALWLIKKRRAAFFLVKGQLDAPAQPVRFLFDKPIPWTRLGLYLSLFISLGTLTFLLIAGRPSLATLRLVIPLIPAVLLFAVSNAFSEEMIYRASLLSTLESPLGKSQALLTTAAYFGIWHYYGVPYGVVGVLMAALLGWFLGKSMLETRGFTWAWFIHFLQDVLIFGFMAIGSVTPGGG